MRVEEVQGEHRNRQAGWGGMNRNTGVPLAQASKHAKKAAAQIAAVHSPSHSALPIRSHSPPFTCRHPSTA